MEKVKAISILLGLSILLIFHVFLFSEEINKNIEKSFSVNETYTLIVDNVNGGIVISNWDKNEIYVKANMKVKKEEEFERVNLKMEEIGNTIKIEVDYYENHYDGFWSFIKYLKNISKHQKADVDINIKMPKKTKLVKASTVNGDISIEGIDAELKVEAVNGELELIDVENRIKGETVNGSIEAKLNKLNDNVSLETVNGKIRIYLPADVKADIKAENINGSIKTDFPLTVTGDIVGKSVFGKVGGGGNRINCETVNGSIYILKHPQY